MKILNSLKSSLWFSPMYSLVGIVVTASLGGWILKSETCEAADALIDAHLSKLHRAGIDFVEVISQERIEHADELLSSLTAALQLEHDYPKIDALADLIKLVTYVDMVKSHLPIDVTALDRKLHYNPAAQGGGSKNPDFKARLLSLPFEIANRNAWLASLFSKNAGFMAPANVDGGAGNSAGNYADRIETIIKLTDEIATKKLGTESYEHEELIYKMSQICLAANECEESLKLVFGCLMAGIRCPDNKKSAIRTAYETVCPKDHDEVYGGATGGLIGQLSALNLRFKGSVVEEVTSVALVSNSGDVASALAATWDRYAPSLGLAKRGANFSFMGVDVSSQLENELTAKRAINFLMSKHGETFRKTVFGPLRLLLPDEHMWKQIYIAFLIELGIITPEKVSFQLMHMERMENNARRAHQTSPSEQLRDLAELRPPALQQASEQNDGAALLVSDNERSVTPIISNPARHRITSASAFASQRRRPSTPAPAVRGRFPRS